jgi:Fe-S cluster biosynthesis and repair protein YggX
MVVYNKEQLTAIKDCIDFIKTGNPKEYFLIEGKAGTGKTTVIKEVIQEFKDRKIVVGALSHKAKNVIRESINNNSLDITYASISGMLGMKLDLETGIFKKEYSKNKKNKFKRFGLIIIDEASMVNEEMIEIIFKEKGILSKVVFLGDVGQLPPIRTKLNPYYLNWSEENLQKNSPVFNTKNKVKLLTRVRQGEESPILPFADFYWENSLSDNPVANPVSISERKTIINEKGALIFINETKELFESFLKMFENGINNNKLNLIKFVTYKNETKSLINKYIRHFLFGNRADSFQKGELVIFNDNFREIENATEAQITEVYPTFNDKIHDIKLYSADFLFEGILEKITLLHPDSRLAHNTIVKNKFNDAFSIKNQIETLDVNSEDSANKKNELTKNYLTALGVAWDEKKRFPTVDSAYAINAHRSQGSTYDIVIVHEKDIMGVKPISNRQKSQCIYTAITRAKNICVVISDQQVDNSDMDIKNLNLMELNDKFNNY